jgi:hypothetical protein
MIRSGPPLPSRLLVALCIIVLAEVKPRTLVWLGSCETASDGVVLYLVGRTAVLQMEEPCMVRYRARARG